MILWLYAMASLHLLVGLLLPWLCDAALFSNYHRHIEQFFWGASIPAAAHAEQLWWIALFGPTVQTVAIMMLALIRIGQQTKNTVAWSAIILGLVLWAPQDMLISSRANCWSHIIVDAIALVVLLPPTGYLLWHDRKYRDLRK